MRQDRAAALLPVLAEALAENGLDMALRPLAKAAGTSDRMLIYYFGSREGLIDAVLAHLGGAISEHLAAAHPGGPAASLHALSGLLLDILRNPALAQTVRIWFALLSNPAHRPLAAQVLDGYHGWLVTALPEGISPYAADALLTFIEGAVVLDTTGQSDRVDRARTWLFPPPDAG